MWPFAGVCVIPGCGRGMGSDSAAQQRFPSSRCREVFCKVTAHNPLIIGIKITQPVSRASGLLSPGAALLLGEEHARAPHAPTGRP